MTKKDWKIRINGSILLFLFIFSSFSLFLFLQANYNLMKGESIENSEELKLSAIDWTTTEVVSTESTLDSAEPTIAVDSAGNAHVAWYDYTNYGGSETDVDIFYKRWMPNGSTWTTTRVVSSESTGDSSDPTIAVDGAGNVHLAWTDFTDYGGAGMYADIFYKLWNATSNAWTTTEVVSTESTNYSADPTIAVDGAGNAHVAWYDYTDYDDSGTDIDVFYKRWNVTSSTWTTTEVVSTNSLGNSKEPTIAVDGAGNVHVVWDEGGSGTDIDVFYKVWIAPLNTWTTTEVVSTESTLYSAEPTIAVDSAGNVHVAWYDYTDYDGSGTDTDVFYKRWNVNSNTWTTTEVVSTESTGWSYNPSIAVDSAGNLHVAWWDYTDYDGSGTDIDVFYKRWNTINSTWTTTEVVSTESTGESWYPTIAVDGAGNAHVAWWDYTDYDGSGTDTDIFYKQSSSLLSGLGEQGIPGYNIFLLIGITCVVSVILIKKRNKNKL